MIPSVETGTPLSCKIVFFIITNTIIQFIVIYPVDRNSNTTIVLGHRIFWDMYFLFQQRFERFSIWDKWDEEILYTEYQYPTSLFEALLLHRSKYIHNLLNTTFELHT